MSELRLFFLNKALARSRFWRESEYNWSSANSWQQLEPSLHDNCYLNRKIAVCSIEYSVFYHKRFCRFRNVSKVQRPYFAYNCTLPRLLMFYYCDNCWYMLVTCRVLHDNARCVTGLVKGCEYCNVLTPHLLWSLILVTEFTESFTSDFFASDTFVCTPPPPLIPATCLCFSSS